MKICNLIFLIGVIEAQATGTNIAMVDTFGLCYYNEDCINVNEKCCYAVKGEKTKKVCARYNELTKTIPVDVKVVGGWSYKCLKPVGGGAKNLKTVMSVAVIAQVMATLY